MMMAFMDVLNFRMPHNNGWLSLTYGVDRITFMGMSVDAWHVCKKLIQLLIFIYMFGIHFKKGTWWLAGGMFALIAWCGHVLIYDVLIKL